MNGQWLGEYSGDNTSGSIIVNLDDMGDYYAGVAFLVAVPQPTPPLPALVAVLRTRDKAKSFTYEISELGSIHPLSHAPDTWNNVKQFFPHVQQFPQQAEVRGSWNTKRLSLKWKTNLGDRGTAIIAKSEAATPSELVPMIQNWDEFKSYVSKLEKRRNLFRGQDTIARLRTKFHRTGRAELGRFITQDIQVLHRHLSLRTRHIYNLAISEQNGAFFNLVQHHGYPTPLLDWTYSPYVAAFFAYRSINNKDAEKNGAENKKVRIFIFHEPEWHQDFMRFPWVNSPTPHFSIMEFMAIDNERIIPQQAASSLTNIDDIETYIRKGEKKTGKTYLEAIDLPVKERRTVIAELSYMGITAGALFPGLDGACEELRERSFDI